MVSVEDALRLVDENISPIGTRKIPIDKSLGMVSSKAVLSQINMPPFRQSAMDGYALNSHELNSYTQIGEVAAGDDASMIRVRKGECVRIFTGAMVPDDCDIVIPQEYVEVKEELVSLIKDFRIGANIRPLGEQIKSGDVALTARTRMTPAAISFVTGLGEAEVEVFSKPSVGILVTGSELIEAGQRLPSGKIYESNGIMLQQLCSDSRFEDLELTKVKDTLEGTIEQVEDLLSRHDVLLVSGGISVGEYDYVYEAFQKNEVNQIFYKVKQKPGKPLFFGKQAEKLVFALPGNPGAALTCFYVYVLPALMKMSGGEFKGLRTGFESARFAHQGKGRAEFLKVKLTEEGASKVTGQASSMLISFTTSDALMLVPSNGCVEGDELPCYYLNNV